MICVAAWQSETAMNTKRAQVRAVSTLIEDGRAALQRGDHATALEILLPLANDGNASAQWTLGFMYDTGNGVPEDRAEAFKWYHNAADQGNAGFQKLLGDIYMVGGDSWESAKWYRKAADQGNADAQFQLGEFHDTKGENAHLTHDEAEALKWFLKAGDQGHTAAQYALGQIFFNNDDYATAAKWFRKAAEGGHDGAQYKIGKMYVEGLGVQRNFVQAYKWLSLASLATSCHEVAFPARADCVSVAANMTPAQLDEAQTLTRKWKSK